MSKAQFQADVDILTTADSGWRNPKDCLWGVFHTTEDQEGRDPEGTARWQLDRSNESSYNVLFGGDGKTVRSNDDDYSPWSVGEPGNRLAFHGSAVGRAARTRADWLARPQQLESMSRWAADLSSRYGLPLQWLTVEEVKAHHRGFISHATYWQAIGRAQGMDVRTDPGAGFPYDLVLARAREINKPSTPAPKKETAMSSHPRDLDLALDQLVGHPWPQFPGWPQLGGLSLVNGVAAIGAHLKIPGFKDMREGE